MRAAQQALREADRQFPVRIRIGIPPNGLGGRLDHIRDWLDANCGADGWAMAPSTIRGLVHDSLAIYFADATLAGAFVGRWCAGQKAEVADGMFRIGDEEPMARVVAAPHKTP